MAELFNLTERRINQLVQKKIISKNEDGLFDLWQTVQGYIRYLQGMQNGAIPAEISELEKRLLQAQTIEREAKARKAQFEADVMEGELLKLEDVSHQWESRFVEIKAAMLELPKRLAFRFTDPDIRLNVEEEVISFVSELLTRYSREGICPHLAVAPENSTAGIAPSAKHNGERMGKRKPSSRRKDIPAPGTVENASNSISKGANERI